MESDLKVNFLICKECGVAGFSRFFFHFRLFSINLARFFILLLTLLISTPTIPRNESGQLNDISVIDLEGDWFELQLSHWLLRSLLGTPVIVHFFPVPQVFAKGDVAQFLVSYMVNKIPWSCRMFVFIFIYLLQFMAYNNKEEEVQKRRDKMQCCLRPHVKAYLH